jgi:hypothetical protein
MAEAPKQNWLAYRLATAQADATWLRNLSPQDRFAIYEDAFGLISSSRCESGNWERLERWQWKQKRELRVKMCDAFKNLDRVRRGLAPSTNAV